MVFDVFYSASADVYFQWCFTQLHYTGFWCYISASDCFAVTPSCGWAITTRDMFVVTKWLAVHLAVWRISIACFLNFRICSGEYATADRRTHDLYEWASDLLHSLIRDHTGFAMSGSVARIRSQSRVEDDRGVTGHVQYLFVRCLTMTGLKLLRAHNNADVLPC